MAEQLVALPFVPACVVLASAETNLLEAVHVGLVVVSVLALVCAHLASPYQFAVQSDPSAQLGPEFQQCCFHWVPFVRCLQRVL